MNSDRIESIKKNLHKFKKEGYQVQHLLELTDFVGEHHGSFKKYSLKKFIIVLFISLLISSLFILVTYPAAIFYGFNAVTRNFNDVKITAGFPFDWLEIRYLHFSEDWAITDILVKNSGYMALNFFIYTISALLLFVVFDKLLRFFKHRKLETY